MSSGGQLAFEAYARASGGRSAITGDALPGWADLAPEVRAHWEASANAVINAMNEARRNRVIEFRNLLEDAAPEDERDSLAAERERAAWTRDIAAMLRAQTGAPPHLRPGILYAANFLDPDDTAHLLASPANAAHIDKSIASLGREDPAHRALMVRLEEQKSAIIAARELLDPLLEDGLKNWAGIERWLTLYSALADPPLTVEVEEDDGDDDDVPHDSPQAGKSSGRWQPLSLSGEPGGVAHLDFAEDAARRAQEAGGE